MVGDIAFRIFACAPHVIGTLRTECGFGQNQ